MGGPSAASPRSEDWGDAKLAHCASLVGRSIWGCFGTGALGSGHEWMAGARPSTGVGKAAMELCVDADVVCGCV